MNKVKNVASTVEKWYQENIDSKDLDRKIEATVNYVKRLDRHEDEEFIQIWAHELVDGHHGQFSLGIFIDELYGLEETYSNVSNDKLFDDFDEIADELERIFNQYTDRLGKFTVGHNDADGSLGLFYTERLV